jgi:hypothetical protein
MFSTLNARGDLTNVGHFSSASVAMPARPAVPKPGTLRLVAAQLDENLGSSLGRDVFEGPGRLGHGLIDLTDLVDPGRLDLRLTVVKGERRRHGQDFASTRSGPQGSDFGGPGPTQQRRSDLDRKDSGSDPKAGGAH